MSEPETVVSRVPQSVARAGAEDLLPPLAPRTAPEREGLPRSYRMRADAHYVDELPPAPQPVIRMLPPAQIDSRDLPAADTVGALTRSMTAVGMLQPLLIRRQGGRYTLIAGRQRLAAAVAAGLTAVPCVLHEVDGPAALALAAADNLRIDDHAAAAADERRAAQAVVQAVGADLETIRAATVLMQAPRPGGLAQQVGADLVDAHARRAAWLAGCLTGGFDENTRLVPLGAIVQRVADGFEAQKALTGLQIEWSVTPSAAVWALPGRQAEAVVAGAVYAALASLDGTAQPRIEVHADAPQARPLRIEVVQRTARVQAPVSESAAAGPAELIAALALRLARTFAAAHGGTAELNPLPGQGSVLQITVAS